MELDLFEFRTVSFTPTDATGQPLPPVEVASFHAISMEKLNALPVETYIQLRDQGIVTAIMAHWISQSQWDRVVARAMRRDEAAAAANIGPDSAELARKAPAKKSK